MLMCKCLSGVSNINNTNSDREHFPSVFTVEFEQVFAHWDASIKLQSCSNKHTKSSTDFFYALSVFFMH